MLKIYGVPVSVHTRKVILAAREKGLAFENVPVVPFLPPEGWADLSPTGKIPVLADGDLVLPDSSVICAYLERAYPRVPLFPAAVREQMRALWIEEFADGTVFREVIHGLFFQKVIRPNILKQPTEASVVDAILADAMPKHFGYLERELAGPYFAGAAFSIADIAVMANLINYHYLGYALDAAHFPKLERYFAAQLRRPSIRDTLDTERPAAAGMGLADFAAARAVA